MVVTCHNSSMPITFDRRAEEARAIAETMNNIEAHAGMLRLSADYEVMAKRAVEWSGQTKSALAPPTCTTSCRE
jgi:hypothetical protein